MAHLEHAKRCVIKLLYLISDEKLYGESISPLFILIR